VLANNSSYNNIGNIGNTQWQNWQIKSKAKIGECMGPHCERKV